MSSTFQALHGIFTALKIIKKKMFLYRALERNIYIFFLFQLLRQIKLISKQGNDYRAEYVEDWVPVGIPQDIDMSNCPK